MTDLTVRRLHIDLAEPFARHWCGGDAFRTALMNALSMSFPVGEQFFIDSVRTGLKGLDEARRAPLAAEVQGFIGQEATHRRQAWSLARQQWDQTQAGSVAQRAAAWKALPIQSKTDLYWAAYDTEAARTVPSLRSDGQEARSGPA